MDRELLKILVCPETRQPLAEADRGLVARLNAAIAAGQLRNKAGHAVEKSLDAVLLASEGLVAYPIVDGIPVLLIEEAIRLDQVR
jgi:uncharacterized protein